MQETAPLELGIDPRKTGLQRLDFGELFGNDHPVIVEIGSGKGRFLVDSARVDPARNYVGIEKSLHYYRVITDRLRRWHLSNVRIINHDAFLVLREMFAASSVSEIHIYFPDPWPRPRERKRRLLRPEVCRELLRVMRQDATGVYVTDHQEYFEEGLPVLKDLFEVETGTLPEQQPRTNYEAKYRAEGRAIYETRFRRPGVGGQKAVSS